ncbi:MAG: hypothetical protein IJA94_02115 [Bacilli bacterium]|nr:hypothetical protein [Bacilli bacterium]
MDLSNVNNLLNGLGINLVVDNDSKKQIRLFDTDNNEEMDVKLYAKWIPSNREISLIGIPYMEPFEDYINDSNILNAHSSMKAVGVSLAISHKNENQNKMPYVSSIEYALITPEITTCYKAEVINSVFQLEKSNNVTDECTTIISYPNKEYTEININGDFAYFDKEQFGGDEDSEISYKDVAKLIQSDGTLNTLICYYAKENSHLNQIVTGLNEALSSRNV